MGDFNAYMSCHDKKGGGQPNYHSMRSFEACINSSGMIDTEVVGDPFTWERDLLKEKIDWAFTNQHWIDSFPLTTVHHLNKYGSDHRPILLRTKPCDHTLASKPPFRCQAAWFLDSEFTEIVRSCWASGSWSDKLDRFTKEACLWNSSKGGSPTARKRVLLKRIEGVDNLRRRQHLMQTEKELWQ